MMTLALHTMLARHQLVYYATGVKPQHEEHHVLCARSRTMTVHDIATKARC
jgi:hypothetical protein